MKTYDFSKQEVEYLQPCDSVMNAMNVAIQVYVVNQVYKRLGLPADTKARYDLSKGELYVLEAEDLKVPPAKTEEKTPEPEKKPAE